MLKINQTFFKLFFLIAITFFLFFVTGYISLRLIIVDTQNLELYNQVWMVLGVLAIFIILFVYFIVNNMLSKLLEDVESLQGYVDEVSSKNYQAVIKIEYFYEFLEISLHLKNLVKRLNNKDSKKK